MLLDFRCICLFLLLNIFPIIGNTTTLENYINTNCTKGCVSSSEISDATRIAADAYDLDFKLLLAVIKTESTFKQRAKNGSSVGLMQVMLKYHKGKFNKKDPYQIYANVFAGASILKDCLDKRKENISKALRCYNGGGDSRYSVKVLKTYTEIKKLTF